MKGIILTIYFYTVEESHGIFASYRFAALYRRLVPRLLALGPEQGLEGR